MTRTIKAGHVRKEVENVGKTLGEMMERRADSAIWFGRAPFPAFATEHTRKK